MPTPIEEWRLVTVWAESPQPTYRYVATEWDALHLKAEREASTHRPPPTSVTIQHRTVTPWEAVS